MTYDFWYEKENGCIAIHTVLNAMTESEARQQAEKENKKALDALIEVREHRALNNAGSGFGGIYGSGF